jgi:hypothetical protein
MNLTALKQAKAEALRFVKRVNALELSQPRGFADYLNGSKQT